MSLSDRYDDRLLGELAALADGSLEGPRRAELEAQVARDPQLAAALAEQQRAVTLIRGAAAQVDIPPALRERLGHADGAKAELPPAPRTPLGHADGAKAELPPAPRERLGQADGVTAELPPAPRTPLGQADCAEAGGRARGGGPGGRSALRPRRPGWQPGLALGAAAALLLASVVAVRGGPTVEDAAAFAALPPTTAAPSTRGARLMASQDGVAFPRWDSEKLGWRAGGMHTGDVDGRPATTVYYEKDGRTLAYTIVAGDALDGPEASRSLSVAGTTVELFDAGVGRAATWERDGHTCVLTGRGVPDAKLAELAGWKPAGAQQA